MIAAHAVPVGRVRHALVCRACLVTNALVVFAAVMLAPHAHATEQGPGWSSLSPTQQQALAPLRRDWASIDATRKQKWLEVATRFPSMPADERARVQQRMTAWAAMTPAQRAQARLQFQATRQLSPEDRHERWEAYRALPESERRRLAQTQAAKAAVRPAAGTSPAGAGPRPPAGEATAKRNVVLPSPAPPARPVSPTLVQVKPGATTTTLAAKPPAPPVHHQAGLPKIVATPGFVDPATLLPKRGPQGAAMRSAPARESTGQRASKPASTPQAQQ